MKTTSWIKGLVLTAGLACAAGLYAAEPVAKEALSFLIEKVPVDHQGPQVIDLGVTLDYAAGIGAKEYPDFEEVYKKMLAWMKTYPNETDYWEVFNKQLCKEVLAAYPMVKGVTLEIKVHPTYGIQYSHTSLCTLVR
jgi:hypothetical protein